MNITKQKLTHRYREQTSGPQRSKRWGVGQRVLRGTNSNCKINNSQVYNIQHRKYSQQYCNNFV